MGKGAACFITTLATVTAIFAAPLPEPRRPRADFPWFTLHKADDNVTCIWNQTCTLPCPFQGEFKEASWRRVDSEVPIIVEPPGQWHHLHHHYKNISSMPGGGAALVIRGVELKHQGLHRCSVTSRTGEINRFIFLSVHAPVVDVSLELRREELVCRSEGIYPGPKVAWRPSPEPAPDPQTSINPETKLFSVNSSVPLTLNTPHNYSCNVSTEHSWRSATYRRNPEIRLSDSLTVPCVETTGPVKRLVWKFNQEIIYKMTRTKQSFSGFWSDFVDGLTESSGLVLKNRTPAQRGLFSCEVSTDTETIIIETEVTDTSALWAILVLLPGGIALILFLLCRRRLKAFCVRTKRRRSNIEEQGGGGGEEEEAAIELNSVNQVEPEENPLQSEDFKLNTDRSESQESFYESQGTGTPRGSLDESSGYGQSGVDSTSIY